MAKKKKPRRAPSRSNFDFFRGDDGGAPPPQPKKKKGKIRSGKFA